jgi:hypothetical protein
LPRMEQAANPIASDDLTDIGHDCHSSSQKKAGLGYPGAPQIPVVQAYYQYSSK